VLLALHGRVRWAIATNLLIGAMVATFNVIFRQAWDLAPGYLVLGLLLIPGSLPGAHVGAFLTRRVSSRLLKVLLAGILIVTGLRLILFDITAGQIVSLDVVTASVVLLLGFGLGVISGLLGVAAGEYRIPALIFLFGVPTVFAGTVSSLASIPGQLAGHLEHRRLGHTGKASDRLGATMGITSIAGVAVGVLLLGHAAEVLVTQVLGLAMILAASRIVWDIRHPHPAETQGIPERA
jgi:uncharacterized membrane protein YfcA